MDFEKELAELEKIFRGVAFTYAKLYGYDSTELYQISIIKWFDKRTTFNADKGTKKSTYAYSVAKNAIRAHLKSEQKHMHQELDFDPEMKTVEIDTKTITKKIKHLTERSQYIVKYCQQVLEPLMHTPGKYYKHGGNCKRKLKTHLMEEAGWSLSHVNQSFREIKDMLPA